MDMEKDKLEKMLSPLAETTSEPVRDSLADEIKHNIPQRLHVGHHGLNTINIIIDLRVSKIAAAAAIIVTMLLFAHFFRGQSFDGGLYQDARIVFEYCISGFTKNRNIDLTVVKSRYTAMASHGVPVSYYGDNIKIGDPNAILMQWKDEDGNYGVIFGDLREVKISADELIQFQSQMLQKNK